MENLLKSKWLTFGDIQYLIPHQANMRIVQQISSLLDFPIEQIFTNIEGVGNTGCASTAIALSQNLHRLVKGNLLGITVFGGGYFSGAMLVRV